MVCWPLTVENVSEKYFVFERSHKEYKHLLYVNIRAVRNAALFFSSIQKIRTAITINKFFIRNASQEMCAFRARAFYRINRKYCWLFL